MSIELENRSVLLLEYDRQHKGQNNIQSDKFLIVEANNVGYKISVSTDTLSKLNKTTNEVSFWTHLHVREDMLDLYGFLDRTELEFFEMLIGVSGIGPKGALAVLGIAPIETLRKAIGTGDTSYLTKISGIGKKTAEKIVLELRDKIKDEKSDGSLESEIDALEALKSLGYSQGQAREALKKVKTDSDVNSKIKEALKFLSNK